MSERHQHCRLRILRLLIYLGFVRYRRRTPQGGDAQKDGISPSLVCQPPFGWRWWPSPVFRFCRPSCSTWPSCRPRNGTWLYFLLTLWGRLDDSQGAAVRRILVTRAFVPIIIVVPAASLLSYVISSSARGSIRSVESLVKDRPAGRSGSCSSRTCCASAVLPAVGELNIFASASGQS